MGDSALEKPEKALRSSRFRESPAFEVESQGHVLKFVARGEERFEALLALVDGARDSLRLCFYIYAEDRAGTRLRDTLVRAARRGVDVTLILDGFGVDATDAFFAPLTAAGGRCLRFMGRWSRRYLIRNHQKIVIADGENAMIGGFNISDAYFSTPEQNGWEDLGIVLQGPAVSRLGDWFDQLEAWTSDPKRQFRAIRRLVRKWDGGEAPVQVLIGGPTRGLSSWAYCVSRDLIEGERLDMMMAYFSPSRSLRKRIRKIARKNRTRLVMAGKSDNGATIGASRCLYGKLLEAGARIWEFEACKLHTKLIVLDDAVYMGSANFDMRSLYVNLEVVLRIEDAALAARMRQFIDDHLDASTPITPELHAGRATVWNRARWWVSWFLVSVVDYTVSRKLNLGL